MSLFVNRFNIYNIYVIHSALENIQVSSFFHLLCKQTGGTLEHHSKSMCGSFLHDGI